MNFRHCVLFSYRILLHAYPAAFRKRFAAEMIEVAESADPEEWPLIFGDTGMAIVRCWIEGSPSTVPAAEPDAYLSLGDSPMKSPGMLCGLILSIALVVGMIFSIECKLPKSSSVSGDGHAVDSSSSVQGQAGR
jgi:hypothetical protein